MTGPWGASGPIPGPASSAEPEVDTMSNTQKSTLKWEKEESLGEMATVAPVLYTNVNFPSLKEDFPGMYNYLQEQNRSRFMFRDLLLQFCLTDWTTRVKQIAKLWRKASSQDRAPYVVRH